MTEQRQKLLDRFDKWLDSKPRKQIISAQCANIAEEYAEEQLRLHGVSNSLLSEKIILALDDYGRSLNRVEYGLPIDPDTKDFEDDRPQEMLKIVTDILNGC